MKIIRPKHDTDEVTVWWVGDPEGEGPCTMIKRWNGNHVWELCRWTCGDSPPYLEINRKAAILKELRGMGVTLG